MVRRQSLALGLLGAIAVASLLDLGIARPGELIRMGVVAIGMSVLLIRGVRQGAAEKSVKPCIYGSSLGCWLLACGLMYVVTGMGISAQGAWGAAKDVGLLVALGFLCAITQGETLRLVCRSVTSSGSAGTKNLMWYGVILASTIGCLALLVVDWTRNDTWNSNASQLLNATLGLLAVSPWTRREAEGGAEAGSGSSDASWLRTVAWGLPLLMAVSLVHATSVVGYAWYLEAESVRAGRAGDREAFLEKWTELTSGRRGDRGWEGTLPTLRWRCFTADAAQMGALKSDAGRATYRYLRQPTGYGGKAATADKASQLLTDGELHRHVKDTKPAAELTAEFDLGRECVLTHAVVWTYRDGGGGTRETTVELSLDGHLWRSRPPVAIAEPYDSKTVIELDEEVGRYLRLTFVGGSGDVYSNRVAEVSLYGYVLEPFWAGSLTE